MHAAISHFGRQISFWNTNKKCLDLYLQPIFTSLHWQCQKTSTEFFFFTLFLAFSTRWGGFIFPSLFVFQISAIVRIWPWSFRLSESFFVSLFLDFALSGILPPYWPFIFPDHWKGKWAKVNCCACMHAAVIPGWGLPCALQGSATLRVTNVWLCPGGTLWTLPHYCIKQAKEQF